MPNSGRFIAPTATGDPEWSGHSFSRLARLCELARLTNREAAILNLYCRGLSLRQMGELLSIERFKIVVWRSLHRSVNKIVEAGAWGSGASDRRRLVGDVLLVMRRRRTGHVPAPVYDERGREVAVRATIVTVDDLVPSEAPDLLGELLWSLETQEAERRVAGTVGAPWRVRQRVDGST